MGSYKFQGHKIFFRILGKFGASNRKMLIDPQALTYREEHLFESPAFQLVFGRSAPFSMDAVELVPSELQVSFHKVSVVFFSDI